MKTLEQKMKLSYSELTRKVYIVDGGKKEDVTQNFIQIVLLWLGANGMKQGQSEYQHLEADGNRDWTITLKKH